MDELLEQFLIEARELTQQAIDDLLALERDPSDGARIDSAFRAVHTLKGSVALFGFPAMGQALHVAEDLLGLIRAGDVAADRPVIDALLDCITCGDTWIEAIATTGGLPQSAADESRRLQAALKAPMARDDGPAPNTSNARGDRRGRGARRKPSPRRAALHAKRGLLFPR
jgi:two-component system chemotaxis sensor kinase CheA